MNFRLLETKEFVVHDLVEMPQSDMTSMILNNHKDNAIWCDGLMLFIIPFPAFDSLTDLAALGTEEHLLAVYYCHQTNYLELIKSQNGMGITLTKAHSKVIKNLVAWIKELKHG